MKKVYKYLFMFRYPIYCILFGCFIYTLSFNLNYYISFINMASILGFIVFILPVYFTFLFFYIQQKTAYTVDLKNKISYLNSKYLEFNKKFIEEKCNKINDINNQIEKLSNEINFFEQSKEKFTNIFNANFNVDSKIYELEKEKDELYSNYISEKRNILEVYYNEFHHFFDANKDIYLKFLFLVKHSSESRFSLYETFSEFSSEFNINFENEKSKLKKEKEKNKENFILSSFDFESVFNNSFTSNSIFKNIDSLFLINNSYVYTHDSLLDFKSSNNLIDDKSISKLYVYLKL